MNFELAKNLVESLIFSAEQPFYQSQKLKKFYLNMGNLI